MFVEKLSRSDSARKDTMEEITMAGKGKPFHTPLVAVSALSAAGLVLAGCSDS